MFKAFTDNISSFIGGSADSDGSQAAAKENDGGGVEDGVSSSTPPSAAPAASNDNVAVSKGESGEASNNSSADSDAHKASKVPPPRPNPPLSTAPSVSKEDDELPATTQHSSEASDGSGSKTDDKTEATAQQADEGSKKDDKFEEVAEKAKEWGSYFFNITKSAGASVSAKAMELKKVVADNTIIGDFVKEQDKFVSAKKEKARANEAAVPPWVGYNEEEQMRTQMLTLSNDKRNFLRNPPTGVQFHFDYETCYPVAMATLAEDGRLQEMRFKLVPKLVSEHDFWRNYFYRVSLIKQSTQLTSLAKQTASGSANPDTAAQSTRVSSKPEGSAEPATAAEASEPAPATDINDASNEDAEVTTGNDEFISDAYNLEISDEDLMKEMEALRASPLADDAEWEEELQKELTDFELVGDGEVDATALENEIMSEMSKTDLK